MSTEKIIRGSLAEYYFVIEVLTSYSKRLHDKSITAEMESESQELGEASDFIRVAARKIVKHEDELVIN